MAEKNTAPADTGAPAVQFTFTEEETPKTERAAKPNPFTDPVSRLTPGSGRGFGFDVPAGEPLGPIRSQLDRAGLAQDPPVSVHWKVSPAGAKVGPAHVHISTGVKITQKRKGTDAPAAPSTGDAQS